jgi:hypothetical protein
MPQEKSIGEYFVRSDIHLFFEVDYFSYLPTRTRTEGTAVNVTLSVRSQYARMPSVFHNRPELQ